MSTQPFGQPPAFGAVPTGPPEPTPVDVPAKGSRTVVLAVAAGVVALGVLGGAAFLVLGTEDPTDDIAVPAGTAPVVEPSADASTPPAPLPTAAIRARNVFLPLVDPEAVAASAAADAEEAAAAATTPAASPTASPTTAAPAPLPVATSAPVPAVTRTVEVPGPVVIETVPGPTVTTGPTEQVDRFAHQVEVVSAVPLLDGDGQPVLTDGDPDSTAVFRVNGTDYTVVEGEQFLQFFEYVDSVPETGSEPARVTFHYASSIWTVPVGTIIGLGPR